MQLRNICAALASGLMITALALVGCNDKENMPATVGTPPDAAVSVPQEALNEIEALRIIALSEDHGFGYWTQSTTDRPPIYVPAGSVNALAAAVTSAGPNGTVILRAGLHTESDIVTITQRVTIIGENGAILKLDTSPSTNVVGTWVIDVGIHIFGANQVTLWNLDIRPVGSIGGTAILTENSPRTTIVNCSFTDFQWSILLQYSEKSSILGNTVSTSTGWLLGSIPEADGIININGANVRIADNIVTNGTINIFCSGRNGIALHNRTSSGFVGLLLCCVPEELFQLPSGAVVGSDISATGWFVQGNNATENFHAGHVVIDGANNNQLVNNTASDNGEYDMELLGPSCLFGFPTPTSFNNRVVVGSAKNMTINDFGQNNTIIGARNVTHNITVPCP